MFEKIKENPKSLAFTMALVLTILSIVFQENELISAILALITSYAGLEVKNFYKGPIENTNKDKNLDLDLKVPISDEGA